MLPDLERGRDRAVLYPISDGLRHPLLKKLAHDTRRHSRASQRTADQSGMYLPTRLVHEHTSPPSPGTSPPHPRQLDQPEVFDRAKVRFDKITDGKG